MPASNEKKMLSSNEALKELSTKKACKKIKLNVMHVITTQITTTTLPNDVCVRSSFESVFIKCYDIN